MAAAMAGMVGIQPRHLEAENKFIQHHFHDDCTVCTIATMFRRRSAPLLLMVCSMSSSSFVRSFAFVAPIRSRSSNPGRCALRTPGRSSQSRSSLVMKDNSSANVFGVGDRVRVVDDVEKAGINLKGRVGTVKETWEKCEVDPTCCCAEFVDDSFAVHVAFDREATDGPITTEDTFVHYFAERELIEVKEAKSDVPTNADVQQTPEPFDGMSCHAFKLDQLKMGQQAQRIAKYEAAKAGGDGKNDQSRLAS